MLQKKNRLPSYLIPQALKKGRRIHSLSFTLVVNQSRRFSRDPAPPTHAGGAGQSCSRFAFITKKKLNKKAVDRNRVKRLFREALRENLFKIKSGYDIVFIALKHGRKNNLRQIKVEIIQLLEKASLLKSGEI